MARGLSSQLITALTSPDNYLIQFVQLEFSGGPLLVHDHFGTYVWDAKTWLGVGDLGGVSGIEESAGMEQDSIELILTGVDATIVDEALEQDFYMGDVQIWLGAIGADGLLVADPDILWRGWMDDMPVTVGRSSAEGGDVVIVRCVHYSSILARGRGLKFTDSSQQRRHSGDLFFQWLDQIEDAKPSWHGKGGSAIRPNAPAAGGWTYSIPNFTGSGFLP